MRPRFTIAFSGIGFPGVALPLVSLLASFALGCASGDDDDGATACGGGLLAGDLVLSEVMANPAGDDDGSEWWIQVARGDDDINTIVLRLSRFASVFNAVAALKRWNWSGTSAPRIVRAMSLV